LPEDQHGNVWTHVRKRGSRNTHHPPLVVGEPVSGLP
jgi:hypothetical protein